MDYSKLRGLIREKFKTEKAFAAAIGMQASVLSAKLNGKEGWKSTEIKAACDALGIPPEEIHVYFFTEKVTIS